MPRTTRQKSATGIYHIMVRGIDKRDIFMSEIDYKKFLQYIEKAKEKVNFSVYAYCLMNNHAHILLKTEGEEIGNIMKRITVGYVQYHNSSNARTGHLFQNRFRSEVVEDDSYFITVLRYIHQNPLKAGIVKDIGAYRWSSYNEYFKESNLLDTQFPLSLFRDIKDFEKYMKEENKNECLEYQVINKYTDDSLEKLLASFPDARKLDILDIQSRNKILKDIKEYTAASNRQLSRVLNIGRGVLDRIK